MKSINLDRINGKGRARGFTVSRVMKGLVFLYLIMALSACAAIKGKFTPKTQANVSIFADTTISMLSKADLGFEKNEAIYMREFYDYGPKKKKDFLKTLRRAGNFSEEL